MVVVHRVGEDAFVIPVLASVGTGPVPMMFSSIQSRPFSSKTFFEKISIVWPWLFNWLAAQRTSHWLISILDGLVVDRGVGLE